MSFTGVNTNKVQGGLNRTGTTLDRVVVLVCGMEQIVGKVSHGSPIELLTEGDLEAKGITLENDLVRGELANYHLSEVFRLSPERSVWLLPMPRTLTVSAVIALAEFKTGIRMIDGANTIGFCGLAPSANLKVDINTAQLFVNDMMKEFRYIDTVILEGYGSKIASDLAVLDDLRDLGTANVSVVIAQDPGIVALSPMAPAYANHAAVGTVLGSLSVRQVHEDVGSVDIERKPRIKRGTGNYDLTDKLRERWLDINFSNGAKFSSISLPLGRQITDKGYIYAGSFNAYAGVFLNGSPTAVEATSDYAFIQYNAVWNKAARLVRNVLLPRVRSRVDADPATGFVRSTTLATWDALVRNVLETMAAENNISGFDVYINPEQSAVTNKPFSVQVSMVANGILHEFDVDLGFTTNV